MFEAAGAAAPQITDVWQGIEEFFAPGTEILVAQDGAEVAELVRTTDTAAARQLGEAGRRRALADHTYAERAALVDTILRQPVGSTV
jgi:spore maturation protein CgeB